MCGALVQRGIRFDISGRSRDKLDGLARELASPQGTPCVFVADSRSRIELAPLLDERRVVAACAGPFDAVGEPLLALAAERGIHYVDTTAEPSFVMRALAYHSVATGSGACIAPSLAYECALADWLSPRALGRLDGGVESIAVCYSHPREFLSRASRGTLLSSLAELAGGQDRAWVDGVLCREEPLLHRRRFSVIDVDGSRRELQCGSVPGAEPLLLPSHTGAQTVRTFMVLPPALATGLLAVRKWVPQLARAALTLAAYREERDVERVSGRFEVIVEASRGGVSALARARGTDPYRVTAEIQAFAIAEALAGRRRATGVLAPSVACDGERGLAMLEEAGVKLEITERSRER